MGRFEERLARIGSMLEVKLTGMTAEGRRALIDQLQKELKHIEENTTGLTAVAQVVKAIVDQL